MSVTSPAMIALAALGLCVAPATQEPVPVAYPEKDILSPFRNPTDVYAPPDELFRQLRVMRAIASRPDAKRSFDADGREVVDDQLWRETFKKVESIGIDAGHLAQLMRLHRNAEERAVAFYGAFYCPNVDYVLNLISHIPGEPERKTREAALPRAVAYLQAHLATKFGDLKPEQQDALRKALPEPGSPAARAGGLNRAPQDGDHLHSLRLTPFYQLLDLDDPFDQAQALWFLKEVFRIRLDLASISLEPALPRIRQLLLSEANQVRNEAIGLFRAIGPDDLRDPPSDADQLLAWATDAARNLFPPIRNLNDAIIELYPSPERDAIVTAGVAALENSSIGDPFRGQDKQGAWYRGFRVGTVPDALQPLAIPKQAVITSINGVSIGSVEELLQMIEQQLRTRSHPRRLFVEYVRNDEHFAVEYRVM